MSGETGGSRRQAVLMAYDDASRAIGDIARLVQRWDGPTPCGDWTCSDLAGHLLCIVEYWRGLLQAALDGEPRSHLPRGPQLAAMNADALQRLPIPSGPARIECFGAVVAEHRTRLSEVDWTMTLGSWKGLGALSLGQHTGVAVGELHVHAWDLARARGADHRPRDAATVAEGQRVLGRGAEQGDPWRAVLRGYGRDPDWPGPRSD